MKNLFLALLLSSATLISAQTNKEVSSERQPQNPTSFQNAEDVAKSLEISETDAKLVWNKYTEYKRAKDEMQEKNRGQMQNMRQTGEKKSDADFEKAYRAKLETQRERINLDENYYNQFLEILPASKVHTLLMADKKNQRQMRQHKAQPEQQRTRINR